MMAHSKHWVWPALLLAASGCGGKDPPGFSPPGPADCSEIQPIPQAPTVILLIDQSGSMSTAFGGQNRWKVLYQALMDVDDGVVKRLEHEVRFGLSLYTSASSCPELLEVRPDIANYSEINAIYGVSGPSGETPTAEALMMVSNDLADVEEPGSKLILLATDGEPNGCSGASGEQAKQKSVEAAEGAFSLGIRTVILTVGNDVSESHQQAMANAGAGYPPHCEGCAPLYRPTTQQQIIDIIEPIIAAERSCLFDLERTLDPSGKGTLSLDGDPLDYGAPNGWELKTPSQIELVGEACQRYLEEGGLLETDYSCNAFGPP